MLLPFNQCPVHEGGLWAASAQRKAQHGSIVKASSPVMYSHIPSHYIPSSPQWNTITAAVQWLWKEKDIILAQYFPFYSAHAEDQALWIFFFWHSFIKASGGTEVLGFLLNSFWKIFCIEIYVCMYMLGPTAGHRGRASSARAARWWRRRSCSAASAWCSCAVTACWWFTSS